MRTGLSPHIVIPSFSWAGVLPTKVDPANLVLWLRADQGVTLSSASFSRDTTEASNVWTKTNCTRADSQTDPAGGTNAIKITDTNDGASPQVHGISTSATNLQSGPMLLDVWLKQGTKTWAFVGFGGTAMVAYINLAAGTTTAAGAVTARLLSGPAGGWQLWRVEGTPVASVPIIRTANGDGLQQYIGDGTGTIFAGTASVYGPTMTQDRVSAWADQSGQGNNATQGTAGNQALIKCYDGAGNWVPTGQGTGCEIGWPIDTAGKVMALASGFKANFVGDGMPMTIIELRKILSVPTANTTGGLHLTTPANGTQILNNYNTPARFQVIHTDDGSVAKSGTSTSAYTTGAYQSLSFIYDGTGGRIYQGGVADAANPIDLDVGTETPSAANLYAHNSMRHEYIVFKSVLSDANRKLVENGMRARWGLAPL